MGLIRTIPGPHPAGVSCVDVQIGNPADLSNQSRVATPGFSSNICDKQKTRLVAGLMFGGEGGIRTHEGL